MNRNTLINILLSNEKYKITQTTISTKLENEHRQIFVFHGDVTINVLCIKKEGDVTKKRIFEIDTSQYPNRGMHELLSFLK